MSDSRAQTQPIDLLVLGGGSAGSAAAAEAKQLGFERVVMVNDGELGGLCILRGCMPTKSLLHSSDLLHELAEAGDLGIDIEVVDLDLETIRGRKRQLVERFQRAKIAGIEAAGYEVLDGRARFLDPDSVEVRFNDGRQPQRLTARAYLIATGSKQHVPPIAGLLDTPFWTSDEALEFDPAPTSLMVAGAGAIGLEFATFFSALGVKVVLCNRSPLLHGGEDADLSTQLRTSLEHHGVRVLAPAILAEVHHDGQAFRSRVSCDKADEWIETKAFLLATGRVPHLDGLDLDHAGVLTEHGAPVIDACLRTTNRKVFAAGDAAGRRLLLHTGNAQGRHVARNLERHFKDHALAHFEDRVPLSVTFTHPPYAEVGLRKKQAIAAGHDPVHARKDWANQGRGIVMNALPGGGFLELIAERATGGLLGAEILGPRADELVHVISTLIWNRNTVHEVLDMPWYHPTLSEGILELARELAAKCGRAPAKP